VKGATGLGFPLIATPTVALLLDIRTAVTILILPNLFMDSAQVIRDGFPYAILRRFKGLIAPTIVGVFLGTLVLVKMPLWVLNLCLGAMVLIFVIASMFKWEFTVSAQQEKFLSPLVGLLSGFLNGVTNAAGPALAIYLYGLKLDKRTFVKSLATIFVTTKFEPASRDLHLESLELVHHQAFGFGLALQPHRILRRVENTRSGRPSGFQSRSIGFVSLDWSAIDCPGRNTG
jgi:uncharacterized membrane protein YfcA